MKDEPQPAPLNECGCPAPHPLAGVSVLHAPQFHTATAAPPERPQRGPANATAAENYTTVSPTDEMYSYDGLGAYYPSDVDESELAQPMEDSSLEDDEEDGYPPALGTEDEDESESRDPTYRPNLDQSMADESGDSAEFSSVVATTDMSSISEYS